MTKRELETEVARLREENGKLVEALTKVSVAPTYVLPQYVPPATVNPYPLPLYSPLITWCNAAPNQVNS